MPEAGTIALMHIARRLFLLRLICLVVGPIALAALITCAVYLPQAFGEGGVGTLGYDPKASRFQGDAAHQIVKFHSNSPLPQAGVVVGDLLIKPPRGRLTAGQWIELSVAHGQAARTVGVKARATELSLAERSTMLFESTIAALAFVLGMLLIARRWRDETSLTLGAVMLFCCTGMAAMSPPVGALAVWVFTAYAIALPLALLLLVWNALSLTGDARRSQPLARLGMSLLVPVISCGALSGLYYAGVGVPGIGFVLSTALPALNILALLAAMVAFWQARRAATAEQRERLRWMFLGFAVALAAIAITITPAFIGVTPEQATALMVATVAADLLAASALIIMAYAILGQRVIDVGFAINRAIVYATLTGVMLVGFGVVEWLVDHVLEFEQRRKSALIDGALALGVFLIFHRLQHWISHAVERTFYRPWRAKLSALERFVALSEHYTDTAVLAQSFIEALDAYTDARGSVFYEKDRLGRLALTAATLLGAKPLLDANGANIVQLKASFGNPLKLSAPGELAHAWAFPLTRRGELIGFVAIGEKRTRDVYRPDEIAQVAAAVRRVGFDLYALRLEQHRQQPAMGDTASQPSASALSG